MLRGRSILPGPAGGVLVAATALSVLVPFLAAGLQPREEARFQAFVLGTAQDGGLPHLGCDRPCCARARDRGERLQPACLGVHDRKTGGLLLIEATPGIEEQVALLHRLAGVSGRGRKPVDALLLTHAHIGHYLGLAQLGREVASTTALRTFVSPRMAAFLSGNGPWSQLVSLGQIELVEIAPGAVFEPLEGLKVTAVPVPHRDEFSDTMAFRLEGPSASLLFLPDVDAWHRAGGRLDSLLASVDVAYLDATFYDGTELPGRDLKEIPHPLMIDTMDRLKDRAAERPGSIRFIHLNHTNPVLVDSALAASVERRGFWIARPGEKIEL